MTKKLLKTMSLVMAIVMVTLLLASCSLFQVNQERYRAETAFEVGNVKVTVGDFVDFYSNTMKQYLDSGYDVQTVWDSLGDQLLLNFVILNEIRSYANPIGVPQDPYGEFAQQYENAQYLTNANDMELILKNVRVSLYQSLDNLVESELANTYTFEEATEEEDRPLNVLEPDVDFIIGPGALAAADFEDNEEELDEYLAKFGDCDLTSFDAIVNSYVLDADSASVKEILADLNKRVKQDEGVEEGDEDYKVISAEEYVNAQQSSLNSMVRVVKETYNGWTMEQFLNSQVESSVLSRIAQEYAEQSYVNIENEILARLKDKLNALVADKVEYYTLYPNAFAEDITALEDSSFVTYVPEKYKNQYAYVKNMLVQFSDEQKLELQQYERYGKTSKEYLDARNNIALQLAATDYLADKVDGEYVKVENIFTMREGNVVLADTVLKSSLESMATSADMKQRNKDFDAIIDRYNEDPGMQGTSYDYVLKVEAPDVEDTADAWVEEFSIAGRKAIAKGLGSYEIAVTDYGVHIVYFSGYVQADEFDFDNREELYTPGTATYRFFKSYYDAVKEDLYNKAFEELLEQYKENNIEMNDKVIKKLLKEYGFEINWGEEDHDHDHDHDEHEGHNH